MNTINESLIATIRSYIQNEKELIPALMSLLNIGKQSVYRRLRNEIPFTLVEASILSIWDFLSMILSIGKIWRTMLF